MDDNAVSEKEVMNSTQKKEKSEPFWKRQDVWVFIFGLSFVALYTWLIFVIGEARGWDASNPDRHNLSVTSPQRFLPEPFIHEEGVFGRYGKDADSRWYYWKLPPSRITFLTRFFPWVCYTLHQITVFATIYYAQITKAREPLGEGRYSTKLRGVNWVALGLNIFFHLVHLINTHTTYDATAQDTPVSSSQSSVIVLLMLILIMEYKERGIAFGWPVASDRGSISRALRLDYGPVNLVRRFHGYAFSWAAVYTFWYHPMENTYAHVLGMIYTYVILLQGSLMYTSMHLNRGLRLFQEVWVIAHGSMAAFQTGGTEQMGTKLWPIFVFGPGMMFCMTHIFSLGFWKSIPRVFRFLPVTMMLMVSIWAYSWIPDKNGNPTRFIETIRMPAFHMMVFLYGYGILRGFLTVERVVKGKGDEPGKIEEPPSLAKTIFFMSGALLIYTAHSLLAVYVHYSDPHMNLILMMNYFVAVFMIGVLVSFVFMKQFIPMRLPPLPKQQEVTKNANGVVVDEMGKTIKAE